MDMNVNACYVKKDLLTFSANRTAASPVEDLILQQNGHGGQISFQGLDRLIKDALGIMEKKQKPGPTETVGGNTDTKTTSDLKYDAKNLNT